MNFLSIYVLCCIILICKAYMPLRLQKRFLEAVNIDNRLDKVSDSLTHDEITKRGVLKSVANYLNEINKNKLNSKELLQLKKNISQGKTNLDEVFFKFYQKNFCLIGLNLVIKETLEKNAAIVDLDPKTKNLAYAHFDSNKLIGSNQRVTNFTQAILNALSIKDYSKARKLSGQVLHTIQDFYSHSNWIEMGNTDKINKLIGTPDFETKQKLATDPNERKCISNCKEVTVGCDNFYKFFDEVFNNNNFKGPMANCPFSYYKCDNNIILLDKILSGYVEGSTLSDGSKILKPSNGLECSHGGAFDSTSSQPAKGGINKDAGYYFLSPHADLHLKSANLAIDHTEYFFDQIRLKIGNEEFSNFLALNPDNEIINKICNIFGSIEIKIQNSPMNLKLHFFSVIQFIVNFFVSIK